MGKKEKKETEVKEVKVPKKTKSEVYKEIRQEAVSTTASRTERNRAEKAARREAKAARKESNIVEEKKRKLSNGVVAIMIFGVLFVMFASVWCYTYFSKEASIQSYIENNGGKEAYGSMEIDENRTASVTAEKNDMNIEIKIDSKDAAAEKEYYTGETGEKELKYLASYYLTTIKPQVRGFSATATVTVKVKDKQIAETTLKYSEAEDFMEEMTKELTDAAAE